MNSHLIQPVPAARKRELIISHSSRETLSSCERKFEFRKLYNHSRRDESEPGDVGNCLHTVFQTFLKTGSRYEAIKTLLWTYPIKYGLRPMQTRSIEACYQTSLAAMNQQDLGRYDLAYINVNGKEQPAVEVPFRIDLQSDLAKHTNEAPYPIFYIGYIDAIFYDALLDTYVILDIKTTRRNMTDYSPLYRFSDQCLPYAMVLEQILGKPVKNLTIKYYVWYIDALEPRCLFYEFNKSEPDILDWGQSLAFDIRNLQFFYASRWFPRRGGYTCTAFNRTCPHYDYCESRDMEYIEQRLAMQHELEEPRPFEPWFEMSLSLEGLQ